jgi:hypothetical protein
MRARLVILVAAMLGCLWQPAQAAPQQLWYDRVYLGNPQIGKVIDVYGYAVTDGAPVWMWDFHGDRNQTWWLSPRPQNPYSWEIKAAHSNKCLDVAGASRDEFAEVWQWTCHGGDNQGWYPDIVRYDSWNQPLYQLRNVHSGLCVDIPSDVPPLGARLRQKRCDGGQTQQWALNTPISNPNTDKVAGIHDQSTGFWAWAELQNFGSTRNQDWFRRPTQDGFAQQIVVVHSHQCLDADGLVLVQLTCDNNRPSQRWQYDMVSRDSWGLPLYRIRNEQTNRCMTITAQANPTGARLRLDPCADRQDQIWRT